MLIKPILYYVHDPMCSWCWGFSHTLQELLTHLPEEIEVRRLLGGLAVDTDLPMPAAMQEQIKSNWSRIEDTIPNVKFNFDFWEKNIPRRSTYPACRAVIAAREQGNLNDVLMTKEIQKAYYQEAKNPSDRDILYKLASNLGLNEKKFILDFKSEETEQQLMREVSLSRKMFVESYPSLILKIDEKDWNISINYNDYSEIYKNILEKIKNCRVNADI